MLLAAASDVAAVAGWAVVACAALTYVIRRRRRSSAGSDSTAAWDQSPPLAPPSSAWRGEACRKAAEIEAQAALIRAHGSPPGTDALCHAIEGFLSSARETALVDRRPRWKQVLRLADSASVESTLGSLDAAEAFLLRLTPADALAGKMPSVEAHVYRYLPKADPRRVRVEDIAHEIKRTDKVPEAAREPVVNAYHAAGSQRHREVVRLGSFFRVIVGATTVLVVVAIAIAATGFIWPDAVPICFHPEDKGKVVCPTAETPADEKGAPLAGPGKGGDFDDSVRVTAHGSDLLVVEIVGLLAAAVAGAAALHGMRGTSTPYKVPLSLALLKLPAGAISAVVGLLLMRGGFVPGLSALDSAAQIIAWAIVFGYAQQLVTGLVDRQAHGVLNDVGGRGAAGDRATAAT